MPQYHESSGRKLLRRLEIRTSLRTAVQARHLRVQEASPIRRQIGAEIDVVEGPATTKVLYEILECVFIWKHTHNNAPSQRETTRSNCHRLKKSPLILKSNLTDKLEVATKVLSKFHLSL